VKASLFLPSLFIFFLSAMVAQTQTIPRVEGESFAGRAVVIPDALKGHLGVLIFGFTKASKEPTSAWGKKILSDFGTQTEFELYQLPVLEDVPRLFRGMVISGIKKGVPENLRDHFVPVLKGESELKKFVGYKEPDDAYLVVLDPSGQVIRQMHGPFTEAAYAQLHDDIHRFLSR